jgi:hypothetical protein
VPGPSDFDKKVYKSLERPEFLPDEFKTWLPRYLRYLSTLQVTKQQIPGIMGENWVTASGFTAPWRHYQGGGTAFGNVRYFKDFIGIVHVEGVADTTTSSAGNPIFTLPAGYRPTQNLIFFQQGYSGSYAPFRIDIDAANGGVSVQNPAIGTLAVNSWVSFAGITFRAT